MNQPVSGTATITFRDAFCIVPFDATAEELAQVPDELYRIADDMAEMKRRWH